MRLPFVWLISLLFIVSFAQVAQSSRFPLTFQPLRSYDMSHPRTREDVIRVWPWRIDPRDGIDKEEARIIAMHEVIERKLDDQCNLSSAYVSNQNDREWVMAVPTKFSLTHPDKDIAYDVCIDKRTGKVTCFHTEDRRKGR